MPVVVLAVTRDGDGIIYQIELQVAEQVSYTKRSLYYASTLIHNQLKAGESYFKITPMIQINILDYPIFPNQDIINWFILKEKTNSELVLTEDLQMIYVELPKFQKTSLEELESGMDIWLFLLKYSQILTEEDILKLKQKLPDLQCIRCSRALCHRPRKTETARRKTPLG